MNLKRGHEEALRLLERGNAALVAPTGYGKSKGVPFIQKELELPRSVHSFPLRSLVQSQLSYLRGLGLTPCHASGLSLSEKCPYLGGSHVVSTVDYLSLTLLRLPPPELGWILKYSLGHHEYPRANVFTSLVVFDEAHLLSEPWSERPSRGRSFLHASLEVLSYMNVKTLVTTATLPTSELEEVLRRLKTKAVAVCERCYENLNRKDRLIRVKPEVESPKWKTEIIEKDLIDFVREKKKEIEEEGSSGKVLIVANTVPEAVKVAKELEGTEPVLVHGRLSEEDKKKAVEKIESAKVVVSTQVIEAGVDVDATWLITESAPISSLAQRAGRLCRARKCEEARVTVLPGDVPYGEAAQKAFEELSRVKRIEWRMLDDTDSGKSFLKLIDLLEGRRGTYGSADSEDCNLKGVYEHIITTPLPDIKGIKDLLNKCCSFVRDSTLIEVRAGNERVEVSLDWIKYNKSRLKVEDVIAVRYGEEESLGREALEELAEGCKGYSSLLEKSGASSLAVVLDENQYSKGWGLLAHEYLR